MLNTRIPIEKYSLTPYPYLAPDAENRVIPDLFGEKHNIVPVCIDTTTLTYKIANAKNDSVIDKGIEAIDKVTVDGEELVEGIGYTINLGNAELTLTGTAKLAANTKYNFVIEGDYAISAVDYISTRKLTTPTYAGGIAKLVDNDGNWTDLAEDILFRLYGKDTLESGETIRTESIPPARYFELRDEVAHTKLAQSFTTPAGEAFYVSRVWIVIRRYGTPSGNMWITIYSDDVAIAAFSDYSGTVAGTVKITTGAAHGFSTDDTVLIGDTTNYNGSYTMTRIDATNFYITHAWDGDDATGIVKQQIGEKSDNLAVDAMKSTGLRGRSFFFPQHGADSGADDVSEVLVDAKGYINSDDLYMVKGADILEFVLKHRLNVADANINAAAFTDFAAARTQPLSIYLDSEGRFGSFVGKLEASLLFKFAHNLAREIAPVYYVAGEAGASHLRDEDLSNFTSERILNVKQKIQVLYNRNPLLNEFLIKETESDIAEFIYKNEETLQVETFLFAAADALALAVYYSELYEKPRHWIRFTTSSAGWDLIPAENKVKITRTRGDYINGTFDGVLFRIMKITKSISASAVTIRALLDTQTYEA